MSSVRSVPTFGAPLDAVSLRRRMRGRAAVGARPPSHPGTTIIGEGHPWRKTSLNSPFQSNPVSPERKPPYQGRRPGRAARGPVGNRCFGGVPPGSPRQGLCPSSWGDAGFGWATLV